MKKCDPFNCDYFTVRYEKVWDKVPADFLIVRCGFRDGKGVECRKK